MGTKWEHWEKLLIFVKAIQNQCIMTTQFFIRTPKSNGESTIFARLRSKSPKIDIKITTGLTTDADSWNKGHGKNVTAKESKSWESRNPELVAILSEIESVLNATEDFSTDNLAECIRNVVYKEEIKAEKQRKDEEAKAKAEAERILIEKEARKAREEDNILTYWSKFIEDARTGVYKNNGKIVKERTLKNYVQTYNLLKEYISMTFGVLHFADVKADFWDGFQKYLSDKELMSGTIATHLKEIKVIFGKAVKDGRLNPAVMMDWKQKESYRSLIYLTKSEVDAMYNLDLTEYPKLDRARDIFLFGVYCCQRVSDYNNLDATDIEEEDGDYYLHIRQKKTGTEVDVPLVEEAVEILRKYDMKPPRMTEQHLNKAIKEVAKMAGITTMVEQVSIRGGKEVTEQVEKYKLVCTHTARRTGATLLYLDKWSMDEIALMTGHKKMDKLQIYLKSTARENARVLREKRMKR